MITARTPNTFMVGSGPVATALAGGLRLGGVPVLGLWARSPARARAAGAAAGVAVFSAAPPDLLLEADAVILAVRDEAITAVAEKLVATGLITRKHTLLHCSGAQPAEQAFASVRDRVGGVAAMHPLRAIADPKQVMRDLPGTVFGIEGDERGIAVAHRLVTAIGGRALELSRAQMAAYHAAAAVASNYLVALVEGAAAILGSVGIDREAAVGALLPLVHGTVANLQEKGLPDGLTGPIRRGDRETVARHLSVIDALPGDLGQLYRVLGHRTVALARELGAADSADLDAIEKLLAGATDSSVESTAYPS